MRPMRASAARLLVGHLSLLGAEVVLATTIFSLPGRVGWVESLESPPDADTFRSSGYDVDLGRPLMLRGAAATMPAFVNWRTDASLNARWGDEELQHVEFAKKETRMAEEAPMRLRDFLAIYNSTDAYLVAGMPQKQKRLAYQLYLPPFIECAHLVRTLERWVLWMSSGETKSVIHKDGSDNLLCQLDGVKRIIVWNASNSSIMQSSACGWHDAAQEGVYEGYGAWARVDVDEIDLYQHPGFSQMPWWEARLEPGDCLFLPSAWYHHVHSLPGRNLAFSVWWTRQFETKACVRRASNARVRLSECTYLEGEHPTKKRQSSCQGFLRDRSKLKVEL